MMSGKFVYRMPRPEDGSAVWSLVKSCPPLDLNSLYCYVLQCDLFKETCVVAAEDGLTRGWLSGFIKPGAPDTLVVWQLAVDYDFRSRGIAGTMLKTLLDREVARNVRRITTTVALENNRSFRAFSAFSKFVNGHISCEPGYDHRDHFAGKSPSEQLLSIELGVE